MNLISSLIFFANSILSFKVFEGVSILEIIIYLIFISGVVKFIKIATKGDR